MDENSIIFETVVGGWRVSTYDDGWLFVTAVTREPPGEQVWELGRRFTELEAKIMHAATTSKIIRGGVPWQT